MTRDKHTKIIYWSDDDQKFLVEVPDLPGCMADGETPEQALRNSEIIIAEWIETAELLGRENSYGGKGRTKEILLESYSR